MIIIHKIEGRTFLLGRNGYYNLIFSSLKCQKNNIFFILIFKDYSKEEIDSFLDDLILKGEQLEELTRLKEHNKIICVNESSIEEDLLNNLTLLKFSIFKQFIVYPEIFISLKKNSFLKSKNFSDFEVTKFQNMILNSKKQKSKCFVL